MNIIVFLAVLVVLIVVHEMGHFIAAKLFGIKVEEFGVGYPPRAITFGKIGETVYTLNWIPFGGFVKIFGESLGAEVPASERKRALVSQSAWRQGIVFVAGVVFNVLFAWMLFSAAFIMGSPVAVSEEATVERGVPVRLAISNVLPDSPADVAGLKVGDSISALSAGDDVQENPLPSGVSAFISEHAGENVMVSYSRQEGERLVEGAVEIIPTHGVIVGKQGTPAIGIEMVLISSERQGIFTSFLLGAQKTYKATIAIAKGTGQFIAQAVAGRADWQTVAGPIGIVGLVGDASSLGLIYLVNFTAMISINLAIINMIPIPALDGGRLLFVIIEGVTKKKIPSKIVSTLNTVGFLAVILLMVAITYHDLVKIIS
jgi:regulator of sigma E protease